MIKSNNKDDLLEGVKEFYDVMKKAKSPKDIEWWVLLHGCDVINGSFLITLLTMAFPESKFRVVETMFYTWVQDTSGNNYDIYWPSVDIKDLTNALYKDKQKLPVKFYYEPKSHNQC